MHGVKDSMIPIEHSRELYAAATRNKTNDIDKSAKNICSAIESSQKTFLVELQDAEHQNVFAFPEWFVEVMSFVEYAENVKFHC